MTRLIFIFIGLLIRLSDDYLISKMFDILLFSPLFVSPEAAEGGRGR